MWEETRDSIPVLTHKLRTWLTSFKIVRRSVAWCCCVLSKLARWICISSGSLNSITFENQTWLPEHTSLLVISLRFAASTAAKPEKHSAFISVQLLHWNSSARYPISNLVKHFKNSIVFPKRSFGWSGSFSWIGTRSTNRWKHFQSSLDLRCWKLKIHQI